MINRRNRRFSLPAVLLLALALLVIPVGAAGMGTLYHPPALTILTENAPKDLQITMALKTKDVHREDIVIPVKLEKKVRAWEQQFRLYREGVYNVRAWFGNDKDLDGAELILTTGGTKKTVPIPRSITEQMRPPADKKDKDYSYNAVLMFNYRTGEFSLGMPFWRGPLMLILRSLIAAALVLLIFRLRSFEEKKTMLIVPLAAVMCYGLLNLSTANWLNTDPRSLVLYILYAILAIFGQVLADVVFLDEDGADSRVSTCLLGNLPAMLFNTLALFLLPQ